MLLRDIILLFVVIIGIIFFLYGANQYNLVEGWIGVGLILIGFVLYIILRATDAMTKKPVARPSPQPSQVQVD